MGHDTLDGLSSGLRSQLYGVTLQIVFIPQWWAKSVNSFEVEITIPKVDSLDNAETYDRLSISMPILIHPPWCFASRHTRLETEPRDAFMNRSRKYCNEFVEKPSTSNINCLFASEKRLNRA